MQSQSNRRRQFWHAWDFRTPINRSTHNIMSCILNISFILIMIDRINFTWRFNVFIVELYSGSSWKHWRLWLHLISFTYYSVCRLIESSDNRRWKSNNYIWVDHLTVICRNKPLNVDSCAWNAGARINDFTTSIYRRRAAPAYALIPDLTWPNLVCIQLSEEHGVHQEVGDLIYAQLNETDTTRQFIQKICSKFCSVIVVHKKISPFRRRVRKIFISWNTERRYGCSENLHSLRYPRVFVEPFIQVRPPPSPSRRPQAAPRKMPPERISLRQPPCRVAVANQRAGS